MATFSVNQARQLYIANSSASAALDSTSAEGAVYIPDTHASDKSIRIVQKGKGGIVSSDIIENGKIRYAKATKYDALGRNLQKYSLALKTGYTLTAGTDYIVGFDIAEYGALSMDHTYYKNVVVRATTAMVAAPATFLDKLYDECVANFAKESIKYFTFAKVAADSATSSITIEEVEQPWVRGKKQSRPLVFTIYARPVEVSGEDVEWGEITKVTTGLTFVKDGKNIADLEWFCMGERGDQYRGAGWPLNIDTAYMVDPTANYNVIDIAYWYEGQGTDNAKSEKTISIAVKEDAVAITNAIIGAINTAYGATLLTALS